MQQLTEQEQIQKNLLSNMLANITIEEIQLIPSKKLQELQQSINKLKLADTFVNVLQAICIIKKIRKPQIDKQASIKRLKVMAVIFSYLAILITAIFFTQILWRKALDSNGDQIDVPVWRPILNSIVTAVIAGLNFRIVAYIVNLTMSQYAHKVADLFFYDQEQQRNNLMEQQLVSLSFKENEIKKIQKKMSFPLIIYNTKELINIQSRIIFRFLPQLDFQRLTLQGELNYRYRILQSDRLQHLYRFSTFIVSGLSLIVAEVMALLSVWTKLRKSNGEDADYHPVAFVCGISLILTTISVLAFLISKICSHSTLE